MSPYEYLLGAFQLQKAAGMRAALSCTARGCLDFHKNIRLLNSKISGNISLAEGVKIYGSLLSGTVRIGRYTALSGPGLFVIGGMKSVEIGAFCSIAKGVHIQDYGHNPSAVTTSYIFQNVFNGQLKDDAITRGEIRIGNDVWIGANASVMSGVHIGNGAIVGAGSIVTKDVEPYTIVAGSPARLIRHRFSPERIEELQDSRWWDWPIEKIRENREFFKRSG